MIPYLLKKLELVDLFLLYQFLEQLFEFCEIIFFLLRSVTWMSVYIWRNEAFLIAAEILLRIYYFLNTLILLLSTILVPRL